MTAIGATDTPTPEPASPHADVDSSQPRPCQCCHADQVAPWGKSIHARAHHALDPIYGKMRELRIQKQGEATGQACLTCHQAKAPGVTCANCHSEAEPLPAHVAAHYAELEHGQADALVVVKLDRFARSVRDLSELLDRFFAKNQRALQSVSENIDTRSAAGRLVLNVLASAAQWERKATGERTKIALSLKKQRGEYTGGRQPYSRPQRA